MNKNKKKNFKKAWDNKHKKIINFSKKMILVKEKQISMTKSKFKNPTCCQMIGS